MKGSVWIFFFFMGLNLGNEDWGLLELFPHVSKVVSQPDTFAESRPKAFFFIFLKGIVFQWIVKSA